MGQFFGSVIVQQTQLLKVSLEGVDSIGDVEKVIKEWNFEGDVYDDELISIDRVIKVEGEIEEDEPV